MSFSIDDESTWRVTLQSPVREMDDDGMDWERCAALHNLIVRLGWTGMGNSEAEMPRRTWWQVRITDASLEEEWSRRLSPSLKLFLQAAYEQPHENFFYYVSGLNLPIYFFADTYPQADTIMCLYPSNGLESNLQGEGLMYVKPF
jgi:hypothetical protein